MRRIIGVTGPMQSGKQEVGEVWGTLGWHFLDLNPFVNEVHRRDRDGLYARVGLAPLGLTPDGSETAFYYQKLYRDPDAHAIVQPHEAEYVRNRVCELLPTLPHERIVLSWGYLFQIHRWFSLDHLLIFEAKREVWLNRVRRAWARLSQAQTSFSDDEILALARKIEMDPDQIREEIEESTRPGSWSIVDTSADDWGESALRAELQRLGW